MPITIGGFQRWWKIKIRVHFCWRMYGIVRLFTLRFWSDENLIWVILMTTWIDSFLREDTTSGIGSMLSKHGRDHGIDRSIHWYEKYKKLSSIEDRGFHVSLLLIMISWNKMVAPTGTECFIAGESFAQEKQTISSKNTSSSSYVSCIEYDYRYYRH